MSSGSGEFGRDIMSPSILVKLKDKYDFQTIDEKIKVPFGENLSKLEEFESLLTEHVEKYNELDEKVTNINVNEITNMVEEMKKANESYTASLGEQNDAISGIETRLGEMSETYTNQDDAISKIETQVEENKTRMGELYVKSTKFEDETLPGLAKVENMDDMIVDFNQKLNEKFAAMTMQSIVNYLKLSHPSHKSKIDSIMGDESLLLGGKIQKILTRFEDEGEEQIAGDLASLLKFIRGEHSIE